jgi:hypothetical protein
VQALARAAASGREALEKELLTYVSGPLAALKEMVTVQLLSIHADGEQTLDERNMLLTVRWRGGGRELCVCGGGGGEGGVGPLEFP